MLVLSRKAQEGIVIGDDVRITVLKVVGNRVTLGIEASPDIPVLRQELTFQADELTNSQQRCLARCAK